MEAYYFRTSDQYEVDLVLAFGRRLWTIEIKLTTHPGSEDFARLNTAADLLKADRRILLSRTPECQAKGPRVSCNLGWFLKDLTNAG